MRTIQHSGANEAKRFWSKYGNGIKHNRKAELNNKMKKKKIYKGPKKDVR